MKLEERIEAAMQAAIRALDWERPDEEERAAMRRAVHAVLEAAYPELFMLPPTHWLAPNIETAEMVEAVKQADVVHVCLNIGDREAAFRNAYRIMRTAHLTAKGEGE